jgi:hypothetical protein
MQLKPLLNMQTQVTEEMKLKQNQFLKWKLIEKPAGETVTADEPK